VLGWMFHGVGSEGLLRQVMFAFALLTILCLAGTMSLVTLIAKRTLMKYEASESLYCEGAAAAASLLFDVPLALLGAVAGIVVMAACADFPWTVFRTVIAWALLLFFVYDSLFSFVAAVAKDTRQAQVMATPFISVFMLFNGFVVSRADAPPPLHWIFDLSPNAYAMEAIVATILENFAPAGLDEMMEKQQMQEQFPTQNGAPKGVAVLCAMIVALRIGQQVGLRTLNHIQR